MTGLPRSRITAQGAPKTLDHGAQPEQDGAGALRRDHPRAERPAAPTRVDAEERSLAFLWMVSFTWKCRARASSRRAGTFAQHLARQWLGLIDAGLVMEASC